MGEEKEVFIRKASGLTRVISAWDALMYAFMNPGILYAMLYIIWGPITVGPGADMPFAVLTVFMLFPIQAEYWLFSVSMPRSGGEYLYLSRALHPSLGLFSSWCLTLVGISWSGSCTIWYINYGIAPMFWNQGILSQNNGMLYWGRLLSDFELGGISYSTLVVFFLGCIGLITTFIIMWRGARVCMILSWITVAIATVGLVAFMAAALTTNPTAVQNRIDTLWAPANKAWMDPTYVFPYDSYSAYQTAVSTIAPGDGWGPWPGPGTISNWGTVMAGTTYVNLNTLGSTYTTSAAGEIKGVTFSQGLALIGSIVLFMLYWELFYGTAYLGGGTDFWIMNAYADAVGLDYSAYGAMMNAMTATLYYTDNALLIHLVSFGFLGATYGSVMGMSFGPVRNFFAWSFDGLLPHWVAKVDRRGSPWVCVMLALVISILFNVFYTLTGFLQYILYTITLWFIGWVIFGVGGIVFPWRRRDIFDKSPELAKKTWTGGAGLGLMVMAAIMTVVGVVLIYFGAMAAIAFAGSIPTMVDFASLAFLFILFFIFLFMLFHAYGKMKGMPALSLLGFATAVLSTFTVFATTAPTFVGGPIDSISLMGTVLWLCISPFIVYGIFYYYRKSQGIPMDLRFKEIPPD
ncbi:MAG: amino acid permease [Promethearchaeota archaeon]